MKYLFLMRHGKSSWKNPNLDDLDRPLNKRGRNDVPLISNILAETNILPELILSSPSKRTLETAKILCTVIRQPDKIIKTDENIYEASSETLLEIIKIIPDSITRAMIVGHNPGLTILNNFLSDKRIDNIPTSGMVLMEMNIKKWEDTDNGKGKILTFDFPKKYK